MYVCVVCAGMCWMYSTCWDTQHFDFWCITRRETICSFLLLLLVFAVAAGLGVKESGHCKWCRLLSRTPSVLYFPIPRRPFLRRCCSEGNSAVDPGRHMLTVDKQRRVVARFLHTQHSPRRGSNSRVHPAHCSLVGDISILLLV